MRIFAFRCAKCTHEGDEWVDDPSVPLECPECGEAEFRRVWSFSVLRSGQETPPDSR